MQLREREASLAALPLPLPLASKAHPFRALGLSAEAAEDLQTAGVTRPTPIQQLAIPELVQGVSAAVLAETGSGKTLAYCLPLATRLYAYAQLGKAHSMRRVPSTACPEALIIVPNRELGVQVAASARAAAAWCQPGDGDGPGTRPLCVVTLLGKDKMSASAKSGGGSSAKSTAAASLAGAWGGSEGSAVGDTSADGAAFEAADIVIATPRTVLQLQKAGRLRLGRCRTVVLDEADELLSAGFVDDVATVVRSAAGEAGVGVFGQSVQVCGRNVDVSLLLQSRFLTYRTLSLQLVCVAATLSRQVWDEVMKPTFPVKMARIATEGLHRPTAGVIQVRTSQQAASRRAPRTALLTRHPLPRPPACCACPRPRGAGGGAAGGAEGCGRGGVWGGQPVSGARPAGADLHQLHGGGGRGGGHAAGGCVCAVRDGVCSLRF